MKLENFEIASSIALRSEGKLWDLHNSAHFRGLQVLSNDNAADINWSSAKAPGLPDRQSVQLFFKGLQFIQVTAGDGELPLKEDKCVSDVVKVDPNVQHSDPYWRPALESSDQFRLVFCFQGGRSIEIESDAVSLIVISDEDLAERQPK